MDQIAFGVAVPALGNRLPDEITISVIKRFSRTLKHFPLNKLLIANIPFMSSHSLNNFRFYCKAPDNRITWFWRFINLNYYH